jgi:hypothetical protein
MGRRGNGVKRKWGEEEMGWNSRQKQGGKKWEEKEMGWNRQSCRTRDMK